MKKSRIMELAIVVTIKGHLVKEYHKIKQD